jgi:hypothetical protein
MRPNRLLTLALFLVLCSTASVTAQKGGKFKPADRPGTSVFRQNGAFPYDGFEDGCEVPASGDRINGDFSNYPGSGDYVSGSGAMLRGDTGEFVLQLRGGNHYVYLNFADQAVGPAGVARRNFCQVSLSTFDFNTNIIDPATGQQATGGLLAIPENASWPSRIRAFWTDPSGVTYTIRFNPDDYPGSTNVLVTRVSANEWTIEATAADVAQLVSLPPPSKGKPAPPADEGFYRLTFRITFTLPAQ